MNNQIVKFLLVMVVLFLVANGIFRTFDVKYEIQIVGSIQLLIAASMIVLYLKAETLLELPYVVSKLEDRASEFKRSFMQQKQIESGQREHLIILNNLKEQVSNELQQIEESKTEINRLNQHVAEEKRSKLWLYDQVYKLYCDFYQMSDTKEQDEKSQMIGNLFMGIEEELKQQDVRIISPKPNDEFDDTKMSSVRPKITVDRNLEGLISSVIKPGIIGYDRISKAEVEVYKYEMAESDHENEQQSQPADQETILTIGDSEEGQQPSGSDSENSQGKSQKETHTTD